MANKRTLFLLMAMLIAPWVSFSQSTIIYQTGLEEYNSGSLPTGWTKVVAGSTAKVYTSNAYSGSKSFGFTYTPNNNGTYNNIVALPEFEIVTGSASLEFWSKAGSNNNYCGQFDAGYITDITDPSTFVALRTDIYSQNLDYTHVTVSLSEMPDNARIAFRHRPNFTNYTWYIDDIKVYAQPFCCPQPSVHNPILTPGDGTIATLRWTENGEANAWNLQYGNDPDFAPGSYQTMVLGFHVSDHTVSAHLTGLTPEQVYYARVQANCTDCGQTSPWVNFRSFRPSEAVDLTVNDGNTTSLYIPFHAHHCDLGGRSQYIIPAESLTFMTDGEISKFVLYGLNNLPALETAEFRIWLKEVDFNYFEDGTFTDWDNMTQVYEGRLCWNGSAWTFEFDNNHFIYQGGNLLVAFLQTVFVPGVPYTSEWIGASQTHYTAIYQDGSHGNFYGNVGEPKKFLPKTTFSYFTAIHPRPWNPTFSNLTAYSVTVSWTTPNENVTSYQYRYSNDGGTTWINSATIPAATTSVTLTDLYPETNYIFQIKALYNDGMESQYASRSFITEAVCPQPQGIALEDVSGHTATFSWTALEGAQYQCAVTLPNGTVNTWNNALEDSTYTFTGLDAETEYIFHLRRDCTNSGNGYSQVSTYNFTTGLACPPPTNVQITYYGGATATVTWDGEAESFDIIVNSSPNPISGVTSPYNMSVDYATTYLIGVRAFCGNDGISDTTYAEPFDTDICPVENRCAINYTLTDAYGNGWGYSTDERPHIRIVDHLSQILIENLTMPFAAGFSLSGSFEVCDGRAIDIIWDTAYNNLRAYECGFIFTDINDNIICQHVGCNDYYSCNPMQQGLIVTYLIDCTQACAKPKDFQAIVGTTTASISWTDNGGATSWEVSYKKASESTYGTSITVYEKQFTFNNLDSGTDYDVLIVSGCDPTQTLTGNFTTYCTVVTVSDPIAEGFEDLLNVTDTCTYNDLNGISPDCWRSYSEGVTPPHIINYGDFCHVHSGNCAMYFKGESNTNSYLALPPYSNAATLLVSFWMQTDHATKGSLGIGYITEGDLNFDTYQELESFANSNAMMVQRHTFLGGYTIPTDATHLVFRWQSDGSTYGVCIDDVAIQLVDKVFNGTDNNWNNEANWTPTGTPTINETVFLQTNASITGAAQAGLIAVGNNATLTLADGGTLMTDNDLVATVEKNITGYGATNENTNRGYCLIANPVAETYYNDHVQLSPNLSTTNLLSGNYDLYSWDYASTDGLAWRNYEYLTNQYDGRFNLVNGQAYLYANRNNTTITFTGTARANNIDEEITTDFGSAQYNFNGWNLIGNPFVCDVYLNDATSSEMAFYRMNSEGSGFITATGAIHPMEGIFVQATAEGQSFKFSRNHEEGNNRGQLNVMASETKQSIVLDNAIIRFGEGNTLEKFTFQFGSTKVYIPVENKDYAVVNAESNVGEMPVNFKAEYNGYYTLRFAHDNVEFSYLHLIDNMTGNNVDLLVNPSYSFNAQTTDYASRFRLVFATGSSVDGDSFGFINGMGNLCIFGIDGEATLQVMDALGRIVSSNQFSGSFEQKLNVAPGVYMIRLINGNDVKVQKIVVK